MLIALNAPTQRPDFFIVPRNVAAAYIYVAHVVWMNSASKSGEPRKENDERDIEPPAVKYYRERWDVLERPSDEVPYWLPDWVFKWAPLTGLPPRHPGVVEPTDGVMSPEDRAWAGAWVPPLVGRVAMR